MRNKLFLLGLFLAVLLVVGCQSRTDTLEPDASPTGATPTEAAGTEETFTDPVAYCAAVGTIDEPDARFTGGEGLPEVIRAGLIELELVTADAPEEIIDNAVWRCQEGKVLVCHVGANIPCLGKADSSRTPSETLTEFCAENPTMDAVPAVVTGRETIYEWRCADGKPEIAGEVFTADAQGFISEFWYELPEEGSTAAAATPTARASATARPARPTSAPTPRSTTTAGADLEQPANGRTLTQESQSADLDGDGEEEQIVTSIWTEVDEEFSLPLQVDILAADGTLLYSQNSWEALGDPSTTDPEEMSLFSYNAIQSVDVKNLTGEELPQVVIQTRHSGTGNFLEVKILDFAEGEPTVLFDEGFYKGSLEYEGEAFQAVQPLYLYNEANCCPCRMETVTYGWDGERFVGLERSREALDGATEGCPAYPQPATWQRVEASNEGPGPRRDATLLADTPRNRVILFGGRSGDEALDDTWAFNLETREWQPLATGRAARPPARFSAVAGVDAMRDRIILTTGQASDGSVFNDVWSFDLTSDTWTEIEVSGEAPVARYGAAGGIFDYSDALYITHGFADTRYDDTWRFDLEENKWRDVTPEDTRPLNRCLHVAAMTGPESLALFGGCSSGFGPCPQEDSWLLDATREQWWQIGEAGPSARIHPGMVSLTDRGELLLFGGEGEGEKDLSDLWILDTMLEEWREVDAEGTPPSARDGHSMTRVLTYSSDGMPSPGSVVLVFGGASREEELNDLWMLTPGDE